MIFQHHFGNKYVGAAKMVKKGKTGKPEKSESTNHRIEGKFVVFFCHAKYTLLYKI